MSTRDNKPSTPAGNEHEPVKGAGVFGMSLFIATLSMLFAASLIGYLIVRLQAPQWPPPGAPALPLALYFSTFVLIGSSLTMQGALSSARRDRQLLLQLMLSGTLLLGLVFLASQIIAWRMMVLAEINLEPNLYAFTFYMLTALHALHVICGLIPLAVTAVKARRGAYSAQWNLPVRLMTMYWHFLLVVWLVMFFVMILAG